MGRGSLFLRFFLVVSLTGVAVGAAAWFVVSTQLTRTLTEMEKRPLEMVTGEIFSIASESVHGLRDNRKETDPTAVRNARREVLSRIASHRAADGQSPYRFAVLDEEGRILVDTGRFFRPSAPPPVTGGRAPGEVSIPDRRGQALIGYHRYFPAWRWHLLTLVPEGVLTGESDRVLFLLLGAGVLAAALVLLLSFLLMRRYIQEPLAGLIGYARQIMDGRYDSVPVAGKGEIRELSEAFHRMTEAIREREQSLTVLAKFTAANPNLVMKVDPDGRILYANQGVERTLFEMGLPPQHGELLLPDDVGRGIREFLASREKTRELTCTVEGRTIHYTIFGFEDEEAVVFHGEDITEKSALEEELQRSRKMETLGRIAGGIAHDFNNLLSGILGYASLLSQDPAGGVRVAQAAKKIEQAAQRGAQITRQLLGFARKGNVEHLPVDLNRIAGELVDIVSRTFPREITPVRETAEDLPAVLGDATQLSHCLMNLCANARDAMPRGGTLEISTRKSVYPEEVRRGATRIPAGTYATVIVRDEGEGMDPATLERIFDPFFTTRDQRQGTGLGMSLVYGTVTNHDGFITVDSAPGKGTTVRIDLPACECGFPARVASPDPSPRKDPLPRQRGTVLLVDDEELVRDVAGAMLVSLGFEILTASNGKDGVEIFRREQSRILFTILDLRMPVMDGTEAFEEIRRIDPEARIVISTGFSGEEDVDRMKARGAAALLSKPYSYGQIARVAGLFREPSPLPVETP